ncbi:uncharacterized protein LOC126378316 [Pectinophora gossypiella]|uniref:uncharacterized protein LOC126378316 n=1 Tax=Pectinophora gossypiella TaxID=13191 RepID=UPI00214DF233|nr:uncharacterized protein LOC126378316 [Pectinophora gossypiella]
MGRMADLSIVQACDSTTEFCLCDLQATSNHIVDVRRTLPRRDFEHYVRNITCYRYKKPPDYFFIEPWKKVRRRNDLRISEQDSQSIKSIKWDWIRNKRSLLSTDNIDDDELGIVDDAYDDTDSANDFKAKDGFNVIKLVGDTGDGDGDESSFERLYKGEDNVYRKKKKKRRKRTVEDMKELILGLKNLPPLKPVLNQVFVMLGDSVTLDCVPPLSHIRQRADPEVEWSTDRIGMMKYDNVVVKGSSVVLRKVETRNVGNYTCSHERYIYRVVQLTVLALPQFRVVFIPMYSSESGCTYDDLRALQQLGQVMSEEGWVCGHDTARIDEPICLEDKDDASIHLRATAILTVCPPPEVRCSAQCRRDLQCALALLCASNAPALSSVKVLLSRNGLNMTLTPSMKADRKMIVTHTLRKKDLQGHTEYHRLAASMAPGNLDIVLSCPAGYYLMPKDKICAACPCDTFAGAGDNACYPCPAGMSAEPGAERCRLSLRRMRRYDWWFYPPCGYAVAGGGLVLASVVCAICALLAHVTSRSTRAPAAATSVARVESRWTWSKKTAAKKCSSTSAAGARGKPLSPSAVILARFFKGSPASSSRVTGKVHE